MNLLVAVLLTAVLVGLGWAVFAALGAGLRRAGVRPAGRPPGGPSPVHIPSCDGVVFMACDGPCDGGC